MPNIHTFQGEQVILFSPEALSPKGELLLERSGWDKARAFCLFLPPSLLDTPFFEASEDAQEPPFSKLWNAFLRHVEPSHVEHLILGMWDPLEEHDPSLLQELLLPDLKRFASLRSLFLGDIDAEELEMAWIPQGDVGPWLTQLPSLRYLGVRGGGDDLRLRHDAREHAHLDTLVLESTSLPDAVLEDLADMELPSLRHLELWLGEPQQEEAEEAEEAEEGGDGASDRPMLLHAIASLQPSSLESLALCNTLWTSARLEALAAILLEHATHLKVLDLSGGTLDDEDLSMLMERGALNDIKKIILSRNYIQDNASVEALIQRGLEVTSTRQKERDRSGEKWIDVT